MDLAADLVARLELGTSRFVRLELSAPFAVAVPEERSQLRLYLAAAGRCWIGLSSGASARCETGDLLLELRGAAHVVSSVPAIQPARPGVSFRSSWGEKGALQHGGAGETATLFCVQLELGERSAERRIDSLPPLIHLKARSPGDHGWVPALLDAMDREGRMDEPDSDVVVRRLSEILLLQILREAVAQGNATPALPPLGSETPLGRTLHSIHAEPGSNWSVEALASIAGASRSAFAHQFRGRMGTTPMRYLAHCRMQAARRLLADSDLSVSEVGRRLGYASEAAFNRAFRRAVGTPPGRYRRARLREALAPTAQDSRARNADAGAIPSRP